MAMDRDFPEKNILREDWKTEWSMRICDFYGIDRGNRAHENKMRRSQKGR